MHKHKAYPCTVAVVLSLVCFTILASPTPQPIQTEQSLQQLETRVLGPDHARQHARSRAEKRVRAAAPPLTHSLWPQALGQFEDYFRQLAGRYPLLVSWRALLAPLLARAQAAGGSPDQVGQWGASIPFPVIGIHTTLLPTGKVLFWSYSVPKDNSNNGGVGYIWNPADGTGQPVTSPANIWCGGQVLLADGRVLVAGGNLAYASQDTPHAAGLNQLYTFNPFNETWTRQPDMRQGRWYPTVTLLSDGRAVITSGLSENADGLISTGVEVFTPAPDIDGVGTVQAVGKRDIFGLYPHQFVLASGKLLLAGPDTRNTALLDPADWTWSALPRMQQQRYGYGSGVLLPDGPDGTTKVMMLGGATQESAVASTEVFDAAQPEAGWQLLAAFPQGRRNHNTVILPDGTLLTVGGNNGTANQLYDNPQLEPELYDPTTNTMNAMAPQTQSRAYHSTAILLPDGRVLSAGDDGAPVDSARFSNDAIEIFSPPYLFRGARPTIGTAPDIINFGQEFTIGTLDDVTKAVLVAPGADTHGNNMHQRLVPLTINPTLDGITASAPASPRVAPPGYYMLFVLNSLGVPSVAKWVLLTAAANGASTLEFSTARYSVNEGDGALLVTVTRDGDGSTAASVDYTAQDGTALVDADYSATAGTLSFAAGESTPKTFSVPIIDDALHESDEAINLTLSNPTAGVTLGGNSSAIINIVDDDSAIPALQFDAANYNVNEAAASVTITVTRSGDDRAPASVRYATSNNTASADADYSAVSGTLEFAAGVLSQTFSVPIINDSAAEIDETVDLTLSEATGAQLATPSSATINISDDDVQTGAVADTVATETPPAAM